jgi:hypothetical protein
MAITLEYSSRIERPIRPAILLAVPATGWGISRFARMGQRWARCGFLASVSGWAVAAAFIDDWGWLLH